MQAAVRQRQARSSSVRITISISRPGEVASLQGWPRGQSAQPPHPLSSKLYAICSRAVAGPVQPYPRLASSMVRSCYRLMHGHGRGRLHVREDRWIGGGTQA